MGGGGEDGKVRKNSRMIQEEKVGGLGEKYEEEVGDQDGKVGNNSREGKVEGLRKKQEKIVRKY